MDAFELVTRLGGEKVNGEARVRVDGKWVTLAVFGELTEAGKEAAAKLAAQDTPPKKEMPAKRVRARNSNGTLKGDDPTTPEINEAWTDGDN